MVIRAPTYLMFAMFAMTTDSVGIIIPEVIKTFRLTLTAAGTFQYATMAGIAIAGLGLGSLADRFGRRPTIIGGLPLCAAASYLFAVGDSDAMGQIAYGFWLATGFAGLLFVGLLFNWAVDPTRHVLEQLDLTDYKRHTSGVEA